MRTVKALQIALLTANAGVSIGCGQIEVPLNLALAEGSTIGLDMSTIFPPPFDRAETTLVGGVETTAIVDLDLANLISPAGIAAAIRIDDLLIAGYPMLIAGAFDTGTICTLADPANPSGGLALIQIFRHQMDVQMTLNTVISISDPVLSEFLGGVPLPFPAEIDATIPITLSDLLDLFIGMLSGGGGGLTGLELTQQLSATIPDDVPILAGSVIDANLTLVSVESIPADPLLADCVQ
jgi:hypothetical protein